MHKDQRLRRRKDFAAVYRAGRMLSSPLLVVRALPNERPVTRFGFVAGKVVGGAVVRNRVKRRLREAARLLDARPGWDIVVGARKPAADAEYSALSRTLSELLDRAGVLGAAASPTAQEQR